MRAVAGMDGQSTVVPALVEALGDEDWSVRYRAVDALVHLAHIGGRKALDALRRAAKNDPDEGVRTFAQQVLE